MSAINRGLLSAYKRSPGVAEDDRPLSYQRQQVFVGVESSTIPCVRNVGPGRVVPDGFNLRAMTLQRVF